MIFQDHLSSFILIHVILFRDTDVDARFLMLRRV
jgi:hypothetical protein